MQTTTAEKICGEGSAPGEGLHHSFCSTGYEGSEASRDLYRTINPSLWGVGIKMVHDWVFPIDDCLDFADHDFCLDTTAMASRYTFRSCQSPS